MTSRQHTRKIRRTSRSGAGLLAATTVFALAACGGGADPGKPTPTETANAAGARDIRLPDGDREALVTRMQDMGQSMVGEMRDDKGNAIVSSASLTLAMGMLREGARGDTAAQMDEVFALPGNSGELLAQLTGELAAEPGEASDDEPVVEPTVDFRNLVINRDDTSTLEEFNRRMDDWYRPTRESFSSPKDGVDKVNAWGKEASRGLIEKALDDNAFTDDTVLALANATYFKGAWPEEFSEPAPGAFMTAGGETVSTPLMSRTGYYKRATADGADAIRIPYGKDGAWSMWLLLPDQPGADPAGLLTSAKLRSVNAAWESREVNLTMPTFDVSSTGSLEEMLAKKGMTDAFQEKKADLSGLADQKTYVESIIQAARITVDEKGTEAAAITVAMAGTTAARPSEPEVFRADRPFAFAIMHDDTMTPLFMGTVGDPRP